MARSPTTTTRVPSGVTANPRGCVGTAVRYATSPSRPSGPIRTDAMVLAVRSEHSSHSPAIWTSAPQIRCSARGSAPNRLGARPASGSTMETRSATVRVPDAASRASRNASPENSVTR